MRKRKAWDEISSINKFYKKIFINQPSKFDEFCFKLQIPYWKLKFKYKYHNSYQEAIKHEYIWKRYAR